MSQHDFNIANQPASSARADINNALRALASLSSGSTAPSTTYANMLWYETDTNTLKMRAEADDAWISIGYLNQSTDTFALFDNTKIVTSGGAQRGILGSQSTAVWEAGTGGTETLVSPAKIKAAVEALAPTPEEVNQTWQDVTSSRGRNTSFQNTTSNPIEVAISNNSSTGIGSIEVSTNGSSWVLVGKVFFSTSDSVSVGSFASFTVPSGHYYRVSTLNPLNFFWSELR